MNDEIESVVDATTEGNVEPQIVETEQVDNLESVNDEVAPSQEESKPVQSAEDNAKYASIRREAESKARDKVISEMYGNQYGIHTYDEYQVALKEQEKIEREEEIRREYEDKGIPEDLLEELVHSKRERLEREAEKQTQAGKQFVDNNRIAFLDWYQQENGTPFDTNNNTIPEDVWIQSDLYEKSQGREGKSLVDAYAHYEIKQLKNQMKATQTNTKNAESSTGSVTGNGNNANTELTAEMINQMTPKQIASRWNEVRKVFNMK